MYISYIHSFIHYTYIVTGEQNEKFTRLCAPVRMSAVRPAAPRAAAGPGEQMTSYKLKRGLFSPTPPVVACFLPVSHVATMNGPVGTALQCRTG